MPKLKTNRAAAKRFRFTKSGKVKRKQAFKNHILSKKSSKRIRNLRGTVLVKEADVKEVRALLPYGRK